MVRRRPLTQTGGRSSPSTTGGGNYFLSSARDDGEVEFFPSGSKLFDLALGGGWAGRRNINIIGDSQTGKTLLAIEACANFAVKYPTGKIRYRECESAFQKQYAAVLGMPLDRVDFGEEQLHTVEDMFEELSYRSERATEPELMIIDSLDALSSRAELARAIDQGSYGGEKAKKMSELFRRLNTAMAGKNITLMIISQIRDKMNAMAFGKKTTRSGGRALDFYCSQIVSLAHIKRLVKTAHNVKRPVGVQVRAHVDKNKVGLPFRSADFPILFGYGIDDRRSCLEWLKLTRTPVNDKASLAEIHALVERRWYAIEKQFLPKEKKYG